MSSSSGVVVAGFIPLLDCAPLVVAVEKGFALDEGIDLTLVRESSWANIRDRLVVGHFDAAHMLGPMTVASTLGIGHLRVPMIAPLSLGLGGNAITVSMPLWERMQEAGASPDADPHRHGQALRRVLNERERTGKPPLTFAMVYPFSCHNYELRYWLAANGIDPDHDVRLIVLPPPLLVDALREGQVDGFCVGEPWNARAIADGIGFTSITTQQMWRDHPEKVCAFTEEFAAKNPRSVKAALKALHLASVYLDKLDNRPKAAEIISRPAYINCPPDIILGRLLGKYAYGDGRKEQDPYYMIYSDRSCNYPQPSFATWWLTQFRRWGMVKGAPAYAAVSKRVMRPDIYTSAMKEMGVSTKVEPLTKWTLWDGVAFDAANPEKYALSFPINSVTG